jgi:DNA-binding NarL/FixJ family response regulator
MTSDGERIRVLLVDDHALFRDGIRGILKVQDDFVVVGEAGDSERALFLVAETHPDVVLLDVEIPGEKVTSTVRRVRLLAPDTRVIILSMHDGPRLLRELLALGIRGYLLKSISWQELVSAIRSSWADPSRVILSVSPESLAGACEAASPLLSPREREVLELTAEAMSNSQIATRLSLTEATVKRHLHNIFAKLGAVSRIDAVNKARAASLISSERPLV